MSREQPGPWHPDDRGLWPHPSLLQTIYPLEASGSPHLCSKDTPENLLGCLVVEGALSAWSNEVCSSWGTLMAGLGLCSFILLLCDPGQAISSLWVFVSLSIQ